MNKIQTLNGLLFARMIYGAINKLKNQMEAINNLNVFPIPDGDTGDNMMMTMIGGGKAIETDTESIALVSRKVADGMLLSARGNSGVILSQFFEGIADGLKDLNTADCSQFIKALNSGVKKAYDAVVEPTEGTMLTVARCASEYVGTLVFENHIELLSAFVEEAARVLNRTPDMLLVLKKAGVVDSGGAGLVCIMKGMTEALTGEVDISEVQKYDTSEQKINMDLFTEDSVLEYGYCTELLLRLQNSKTDPEKFDTGVICEYLKCIGDSVAVVKSGSAVKIHVHTMTPEKVLEFCRRFGEFLKVKVENMSLQHSNISMDSVDIQDEFSERKKYGIVAVASGEGIKQMLEERGADVIIEGGRTINPSVEDFLDAFNGINAENILVFPNNSNILLTAQYAAEMADSKNVTVVESCSVGECYAALAMFDPECSDAESLVELMNSAMEEVSTAEITRCIRNVELTDMEVRNGDYIGFSGKKVLAKGDTRLSAVCSTVDRMNSMDSEICIVIYGNNVEKKEAETVESYININRRGMEVYLVSGMQDFCDYMLIFE